MVKALLRNILANYIGLITSSLYLNKGLIIENGWLGYTKSVVILTLVFPIIKPLLKILFLPINIITLGVFNFFLGMIFIYLLTLLVPDFKISPQPFPGISLGSIIIEPFVLNRFWVMFVVSLMLTAINRLFSWLTR